MINVQPRSAVPASPTVVALSSPSQTPHFPPSPICESPNVSSQSPWASKKLSSYKYKAIFVQYLAYEVNIASVCKKWRTELHATLVTSWNHLPSSLRDAKEASNGANYFRSFLMINAYLTAELRQLDDDAPKAVRRQFKGSLTTLRFVAMQKQITTMTHARAAWQRLRKQNESLADIDRLTLMNREVANPGRRETFGKLKKLDLREIGLLAIPPFVFNLTALEQLNLSHNQLDALPDDILKLKGLVAIHLSGNPLAAEAERDHVKKAALIDKLKTGLPELREIHLNGKVVKIERPTGGCSCTLL